MASRSHVRYPGRRELPWCAAVVAGLLIHAQPVGALRYTPRWEVALQASVGWSTEEDGLLLVADEGELARNTGLPRGPHHRIDPEAVAARQRARARSIGVVVLAEASPEVVALAAPWAHRTGAALFLDPAALAGDLRCDELHVLGEIAPPGSAVRRCGTVRVLRTRGEIVEGTRGAWPSGRPAVLVDPEDPYAPLGVLAAQARGLPVLTRLGDVTGLEPASLAVWASPGWFGDHRLLALSRRLDLPDGFGILTGPDPVSAQLLWHRGRQRAEPGPWTVAHAANPASHVGATIRFGIAAGEGTEESPLTVENLAEALRRSAYVGFSGHGGASYLRLGPGRGPLFRARDVPSPLPPLVFVSGSCQTFRFWEAPERSLALAFVRGGAAAFIGFAYSPLDGFLPGQLDGAPAMAAHDGFPLGRVVRLLNHSAGRAFSRVPFLFLLGDPQMAPRLHGPAVAPLSGEHPGERRFVVSRAEPEPGWTALSLPAHRNRGTLRLLQGGREIARSQLTESPFHGSLVAVPRNGAVDVLARLPAGEVMFVLEDAGPGLHLADRLVWSLDYALPYLTGSQGYGGQLALLGLWLGALALGRRRRFAEAWRRHGLLLATAAAGAGTAYLAYCALRWPWIDVTARPLELDPISTLVPAGAAVAFLSTRLTLGDTRAGRLLAAAAAGLAWWGPGLLVAGVILGGNLLVARRIGTAIWSLGTATPLLLVGAICSGLAAAAVALAARPGATP